MTGSRPPRWMVRALRALLPEAERDFILGDLEEEFRRTQAGEGRAKAVRGYLREGARTALSLVSYTVDVEGMMMGLGSDVRGALRIFRRRPGFAGVVVLMLGLGVGGATAVYSVLRGVVLSPLEFENPDDVVMLWGRSAEYPRAPLTVGDYNALATGVDAFESVTASWSNTALLTGENEAEQVSVGWVTPTYFDVVTVDPALGRTLERDDHLGVVISHDLWLRRWGADPDIIGRTVPLPGASFEIVGVLPRDRNPNLSSFAGNRTSFDIWRLQPPEWLEGDDRSVGWLRATARLRDGVTLAQAQAETDAFIRRVNETVTARDGGTDLRVDLIPAKNDLVGDIAPTLWILLAAVFGVLLIAAGNVANLLLVQGEARSSEIALRATLGGSRSRLVRQLLVESGVLAVLGGFLGVGLASLGLSGLLRLAPPNLPRLEAVTLDWTVFSFALGTTALAALVFGVLPAIRASRSDLAMALGDRRTTAGPGRRGLKGGLIVLEVALSLTLLTATGLLLRSLSGLHDVDLGFDPGGLVTFALEAPEWGQNAQEAGATMTAYLDAMRSVPGVEAAAFTNRVPLGGGLYTGSIRSEEMAAGGAPTIEASFRWVTPGFFETFGARLLRGRSFRPGDDLGVAIVDERTAGLTWPGEDPLGRRLETSTVGGEPQWAEVVGVVAPMKHAGVAPAAPETVFLPMLAAAHQQNFRYGAVRTVGEPLAVLDPLREAVGRVDGGAVIARVRTMDQLVRDDTSGTRFASVLLTVFSLVGLFLATVGLYGLMAYSVRLRSREMGIRVALGADRESILFEAVRSGVVLLGWGVLLGLTLSLGAGRVLESMLFGVGSRDLPTLFCAAAVMVAVGVVGTGLPARRVLLLDPAATLREE